MTNLATNNGAADQLFELHPAPSLLFGRDGVLVQANAALQQLLRASGTSLDGTRLAEFFPEVATQLADLRAPVCLRRVAVRRPDGSNFIARVQAVPDTWHGLSLAVVEDLTEKEQELAAANKEFEALTSAAGHDLRGPLRILKGFAEALDDECGAVLNEEGKTFLKEIFKASDRMDGLIDGLLTFSRAGRAELSCENLDVGTLVELVHYDLRHAATERTVAFEMQPGISAWGDVRQMMTILRTLLGNAWKYTGRTPQRRGAPLHRAARGPDLDLRERQRRGIRHEPGRATVPALHAPAPPGRIRRPWHGPGHRLAHRPAARRPHRGRRRGRRGRHGTLLVAAS